MTAEPDELRELAPPTPAPLELCAHAAALVRRYTGIFWFQHSGACIRQVEDVRLLMKHLRENGDHRAWLDAQELQGHLLHYCGRR